MIRKLKSSLKALFHVFISVSCLWLGEPFFRVRGMRHATSMPKLPEMQRILVVRLDQIGDVVMTIPMLRELRKNAPHAHITLVVKPEIRELAASCPYIDEILVFENYLPQHFMDFRRQIRTLKFCYSYLWPKRFDLAIIPRWDVDLYYQTFLAYFSGSRWRIGYSEDVTPIKRANNRGYDRLMTHVLHQNLLSHEVERNLTLLKELGGIVTRTELEIWTTPAEDIWAKNWLNDRMISESELLIAFGPFAGNSSLKKWPLHNFVELGRWLANMPTGRILIVGGSEDQDQAQRICEEIGPRAINSAGQCSLPQTLALLKHCSLYVGNDSGPMHLASAVGIPIIALFGPSCPHRFEPWTPKKQVIWMQLPCSPCAVKNHADCCTVCIFEQPHCIQSISVHEVQAAIKNAGHLNSVPN